MIRSKYDMAKRNLLPYNTNPSDSIGLDVERHYVLPQTFATFCLGATTSHVQCSS